jgi:adenylosuccinate synthase
MLAWEVSLRPSGLDGDKRMLDIVIGAQWGDEGKGRLVDLLAAQADYVARFSGGDNAGHTVTVGSQILKLHLVPSGLIQPRPVGVLGNGMVINPETLLDEMDMLQQSGIDLSPARLRISYAAHIITPGHRALDAAQEAARGRASIGTTLRGIGPAYTDKVSRQGLRIGQMLAPAAFADALRTHIAAVNRQLTAIYHADPLDPDPIVASYLEYASRLAPFIADVSLLLAAALSEGKKVLAEGAQGTLLDLDHGTYPFVTSSHPTAAGALLGLGLGVRETGRVIGVTKAFQTRVGAGPLPTEVEEKVAELLRGTGENPWDEFGTTTGRPRRVGWLDLVLLRYAVRVNGLTELALTKLDVLSGLDPLKLCVAYRRDGQVYDDLPLGPADLVGFEPVFETLPGWSQDVTGARAWEELPEAARAYIARIETASRLPIRLISVGPERSQVVAR